MVSVSSLLQSSQVDSEGAKTKAFVLSALSSAGPFGAPCTIVKQEKVGS